MVVIGEEVLVSVPEGVGFPHKLQSAAGVGGEDQDVLLGVGLKELQHPAAALGHTFSRQSRGRVRGVGVSKDCPKEKFRMSPDLGLAE